MPKRTKKPCRDKSCRSLHRNKNGYCDQHAALASGWTRSNKGKSTTERGYGHEWQQLRAQILEKDGGLCRNCKKKGIVSVASQVDHIINKARGGTDDPTNLQALCDGCHEAKTVLEI